MFSRRSVSSFIGPVAEVVFFVKRSVSETYAMSALETLKRMDPSSFSRQRRGRVRLAGTVRTSRANVGLMYLFLLSLEAIERFGARRRYSFGPQRF